MKEFDNWGMKESNQGWSKLPFVFHSNFKGVSVYKSHVVFVKNNKIWKKKSDWSGSNSRALHF